MKRIPIDFSAAPHLEREFLQGRHARTVLACVEGIKNQQALNQVAARPHRAVNGLGAATHYIDPTVAAAWARREGSPDVIHDKAWLRYMEGSGVQRVRSSGTKTQVGYGTGRDIPHSTIVPRKAKYKKIYPTLTP